MAFQGQPSLWIPCPKSNPKLNYGLWIVTFALLPSRPERLNPQTQTVQSAVTATSCSSKNHPIETLGTLAPTLQTGSPSLGIQGIGLVSSSR